MSATPQNDRVNNITLEDINASIVDTVNKSSEIMKRVVARPKQWNGRSHRAPIFTNNSQLGTSFKGTETFDTSIDFNTQNLTWYPTGYAQPVGVSLIEQSINKTPAGVINLVDGSYQYAQNSMITALGNIFYGYGSGNDFDGLGLIVDDGTNTSTYGGLSRSQYPTINAFLTNAPAGKLDLETMAAADDGATISGDLSETPNLILSDQTTWSYYESLLTPTANAYYNSLGGEFINGNTNVGGQPSMKNSNTFNGGANSLTFRGKDYVRDQKSPAGTQWFINEKWFEFRSLPINTLDMVATTETVTTGAYDKYKVSAFQFRKYIQPVGQLAEVGIFVMYGNLICTNPNRTAKISGITGV
jgi:hypothetical protein